MQGGQQSQGNGGNTSGYAAPQVNQNSYAMPFSSNPYASFAPPPLTNYLQPQPQQQQQPQQQPSQPPSTPTAYTQAQINQTAGLPNTPTPAVPNVSPPGSAPQTPVNSAPSQLSYNDWLNSDPGRSAQTSLQNSVDPTRGLQSMYQRYLNPNAPIQ